jgi:hypothetical protein
MNHSYGLGGLVGYNNTEGDIRNCYSTGPVTVGDNSYYLGGLIGRNWGAINNCYSMGVITTGFVPVWARQYIGGLMGVQESGGSINNSYFLITSGQNNGYGQPLTDEQMKQQSNFVGWDFIDETANGYNNFWRLCNEGLEYPALWWQYLPGDIACSESVDIFDLASLCEQWLIENTPPDMAPPGGNGIVNFAGFFSRLGRYI